MNRYALRNDGLEQLFGLEMDPDGAWVRYDDAIRALSDATQRWIPVSERMPADSFEVAVCGEECCDIARWDEGEWHIENSLFNVTHWMPLPEAPK